MNINNSFNKRDNGFPCKDCTKRHLGCHDTCAEYLEIKKAMHERNAQLHQARRDDNTAQNFLRMNAIGNLNKRHKRKNKGNALG